MMMNERVTFLALSALLSGFAAAPAAQESEPREAAAVPPLRWATVDERMAAEEAAGFAGALILVRDGEVVHERGYGLANREKGHAVTPDTVFGIGSTPIDFTKAGILLLVEEGKVWPSDSITEYFKDVPADKQGITIEHLMTGRSGLPDFHDLPTDRDPDHSWIDRAEAMRRIFAQELLFPPGTRNEHSHSAWGVLAAVLEIASGRSYQEFVNERLFEPAGMKDTGFFGEEVPVERLAIGYGDRTDGEINAPPYWGKTSWLVMGSGGMVSTVRDMLRWNRALREGKLLTPESLELYWAPPGAVLSGGDMYGFEIVYTEGVESHTLMILISNAIDDDKRPAFGRLARDLARLASS